MNSKAQVSAEFYIFIGISLIFTIAVGIYSIRQVADVQFRQENENMRDVALKLQREVLIATYVEDGYVRTFTLPETVNGINYTIKTMNSSLVAASSKGFYLISIPKVAGNFTKGTNTINKTGGVIYIN